MSRPGRSLLGPIFPCVIRPVRKKSWHRRLLVALAGSSCGGRVCRFLMSVAPMTFAGGPIRLTAGIPETGHRGGQQQSHDALLCTLSGATGDSRSTLLKRALRRWPERAARWRPPAPAPWRCSGAPRNARRVVGGPAVAPGPTAALRWRSVLDGSRAGPDHASTKTDSLGAEPRSRR